jgi:acyl dehydratase
MAEPRVFANPGEIAAAVGEELGTSSWHAITQAMVDAFAQCTDDEQWIHVDPARAAVGPYGGTIAHGFLTLALIPSLLRELYRVEKTTIRMNYGLDRVRFLDSVPVGTNVRANARIAHAVITGDRLRVTFAVTIEREGHEKPACVADQVLLMVPDSL